MVVEGEGEQPVGDGPVAAAVPSSPAGAAAGDELLVGMYAQLRDLARARMANLPPGQTLQPTALVHEAYARLAAGPVRTWDGRRHFFFAAARAMRDVLVELARSKAGPTRGGTWRRTPLDPDRADPASGPGSPFGTAAEDVLAVDEALAALAAHDPFKAQLVELRYFAGLTMDEAADVLGESTRSLDRHWRFARAWLRDRLD